MKNNKPVVLKITDVTDENKHIKTFWFDYDLNSKPGQFVMLWIPNLDQKPFSISYDNGGRFGITVFPAGPFSQTLHSMGKGDRIGVSGPYGNPFSTKPNARYIAVGGGYGTSPLAFLAEELRKINSTIDFCVGAKNSDMLLFEKRIKKLPNANLYIATDDGSRGYKGFVTEILENILANMAYFTAAANNKRMRYPAEGYSRSLEKNPTGRDTNTLTMEEKIIVAACGPELMEKKVLNICNKYNIDCEISIERYIKCGFGICGQCAVDPLGIKMCQEGPVIQKHTANQIIEFGEYKRGKSGAKNYFNKSGQDTPTQKEVIGILKNVNAIMLNEHFVGTSGRHLEGYINKDALLPHTSAASRIGELFAEKFKNFEIDTVAAPAMGGIILSQWTAHHLSRIKNKTIHAVYAEKTGNSLRFTRGYDKFIKNKKVLIIEDLTTTGGSLKKAIDAAKDIGGKIAAAGVMVNKSPDTVTASMFRVPFLPLAEMEIKSFEEYECPLCENNIPINTAVGHGKKYIEEKRKISYTKS